jgi:DNA ligase 1
MKTVMLAANTAIDIDKLKYPKLLSGKIDGVRVCVQNGLCVAGRSLKPSINTHAMNLLSDILLEGFDGELTVQGPRWNDFNYNQSVIMTKSGTPKLTFWVFDLINSDRIAAYRKQEVEEELEALEGIDFGIDFKFCTQHVVNTPAEVMSLYNFYLNQGYEGVILMDPEGMYKHGRSTAKQELMLKIKPTEDSEATIIGFNELMHNDDAGNSKMVENMVPGCTLGSLVVSWNNKVFNIGSGLNDEMRAKIWTNKETYIGKLVTFKYMQLSKYGVPRHPIFKGIRNKDDL